MSRELRAVIFDLDGTLADTLTDIAAAASATLGELGVGPYELEQYRAWIGGGARRLMEQALPADQQHRLDEVDARFRQHYAANLVVATAPYAGIPAVLDALAERFTLAVLSNKPHAMTTEIVARVFGAWDFADVVGKQDGVPAKPDPTSVLAMAARLGVDPSMCAYVGDTDIDVQTATAAGMLSVGVSWGFRDAESLVAAGALRLAASPEDLLRCLIGDA